MTALSFFAYIDPGLGLLAWQALAAAFVGTLFYLKKTRTWLVAVIAKPFRAKKPPEETATKTTAPTNHVAP